MKRLAKILAEVKKGDYVTVQFAHNDQKNANNVANYEATLTKYANEIKAKGAIPLFVTSTARQGELDPKTSVGSLPEKMRALGKKLGVTVLDLNQHTVNLQKALGSNKDKLYMYTAKDKTHFCEYGAYELARAMMEEIKAKVPTLAKHLRDDHEAFNSNKPDPLDVLSLKKAPITEGGLVEVGPEIIPTDTAKVDTVANDSTAISTADSTKKDSTTILRGATIAEALTVNFDRMHKTISVHHGNRGGQIQLFDSLGKEVFNSTFNRGNSAETFNLPPQIGRGIYYLKVLSGSITKIQRLNIAR
jgi:hypothetical protein